MPLNRNLAHGHQSERATEAELGDLADEAVGLKVGCGLSEVVGPEILVEGAIAQHVMYASEMRRSHEAGLSTARRD